MKIGVLIKTVRFVNAQTGTDMHNNYVCSEDFIHMLNPLDELALEYALTLKDQTAGVKIVAISLGDRHADEGLRRALAMGVDDAIHIRYEEHEGLDAMATSALLARACEREHFDLILSGEMAIDDNDGLEGPYLAGRLAIPHISRAVKISVDNNSALLGVERVVERGNRQLMQCSMPAMLTVQKGAMVARYPTLAGFLSAESYHVKSLTPADLDFPSKETLVSTNLTEVVGYSNPKPKKQREALERSNLSAGERLNLMVSRDASKGKEGGKTVEGGTAEMFDRLDVILADAGILKR